MNLNKFIYFLCLLMLPYLTMADIVYKGLAPNGQMVPIPNPNQQFLPNPYYVYKGDMGVINHPSPGFKKIAIPVNNRYRRSPGCYVMCYHYGQGLYSVGQNIFTQGMIRVEGSYHNTLCVPKNMLNKDISAMQKFKDLCNQTFKACKNGCWAGGDTGGWYGMQYN